MKLHANKVGLCNVSKMYYYDEFKLYRTKRLDR